MIKYIIGVVGAIENAVLIFEGNEVRLTMIWRAGVIEIVISVF